MRKYFIMITLLISCVLQLPGIKRTEIGPMSDNMNWEFVKAIPETGFMGDCRNNQLIVNTNPYKLQFQDDNGRILWTKKNLRIGNPSDYAETKYSARANIKSIIKDESTLNPIVWGEYCLLMDQSFNKYVLVDKNGNEVYLPQNSASMEFVGFINNKYLMFYQMDYQDFKSTVKSSEIEPYPRFNIDIKYSDVKNWCVIFNMMGSIVKQFKLSDVGVVQDNEVYLNEDLDYIVYKWWDPESDSTGSILMSTNGEVLNTHSGVYRPFFSEDRQLWIPQTEGTYKIEVLDIKTGERVFIIEDMIGSKSAVSNRETACIIYTFGNGMTVLDYKNNSRIFYISNEKAWFSYPWISGDGKEIRFTYQEKNKPAEIRFYKMK